MYKLKINKINQICRGASYIIDFLMCYTHGVKHCMPTHSLRSFVCAASVEAESSIRTNTKQYVLDRKQN